MNKYKNLNNNDKNSNDDIKTYNNYCNTIINIIIMITITKKLKNMT